MDFPQKKLFFYPISFELCFTFIGFSLKVEEKWTAQTIK